LASVKREMKEGRGEGGGENGCGWYGAFRGVWLEEEGKSSQESKDDGGGERVKVGAIESEIGGGAEVGAEEVRVSNHAGENDRDCGRAGNAREGGAL